MPAARSADMVAVAVIGSPFWNLVLGESIGAILFDSAFWRHQTAGRVSL